jgi:hypothetical protein
MTAHKIDFFLNSSTNLQPLLEHAQYLNRLQQLLEAMLPQGLAQSCKVGAMEDKTLVLFAESGAIAAKIKQSLPTLLDKFQRREVEITAIRIAVQVQQPAHKGDRRKEIELSDAALGSLRTLAAQLDDTPLKSALDKLVDRHTRGT